MIFAAFETSGDWCSVALSVNGEIAALDERASERQAARALPMLAQLLADAELRVTALDAVAFGAGPGSFTGLRIACSLAQGLAMTRGLPVLGISSLEALAEASGAERVVACLDARMREVYFAALERCAEGWREVLSARCVPPQAAPAPPGEGWLGCGNGFAVHADQLAHLVQLVNREVRAHAAAVASLAHPRLARGEGGDAAHAMPSYLREKIAWTVKEREARMQAGKVAP